MSLMDTGLLFIFLTITITGMFAWGEEWISERLERKRMKEALAR